MTPEAQALVELAERCEAATGADDALDLAIAGWCYLHGVAGINYNLRLWLERHGWSPTASLDAAMSLVPEGCRFEVTTTGYKPGGSVTWYDPTANAEGAYAATPALALTAAALRARAALLEKPERVDGVGEPR